MCESYLDSMSETLKVQKWLLAFGREYFPDSRDNMLFYCISQSYEVHSEHWPSYRHQKS